MKSLRTPLLAGALALGPVLFLTSCGEAPVNAAEDSEAARELRKAREAFSEYANLKAEEYRARLDALMAATDARIAELRQKAAASDAAAKVEQALAELKTQREALAGHAEELRSATEERFKELRDEVAGKVDDLQSRLEAAWQELTR